MTVPADPLVGDFRLRHHPRAVLRRLPPHVTIVPPFLRDVDDDEALGGRLERHAGRIGRFDASLTRVGRFRRHVWLAPEPRERFVGLISAARAAFPDLFRDAELEREPTPHVTIAEIGKGGSVADVAELADSELGPRLPFCFAVDDLALYEVRREGWHEVRRFRLG